MSTDYKEVIHNRKHRLFAWRMYDKQDYTPVCDITFDDRYNDGTHYYPSFAYDIFYDLTPKPFNRALDIFRGYASKYGTFCKYEKRKLFTVRKLWRTNKRYLYNEWGKDFETLEEATKCFKWDFDELVRNKNQEIELSLMIHYKGYQRGMFGDIPHDFVVSILRVDFSTMWEYYNNAGFQLECYFYPMFDSSLHGAMLKEQRDYKNFAYQIFTDVRKLQGLHLNIEQWGY